MQVKTAEATGLALDWGLAVAMGADHIWHYEGEVCAQYHLVEYEPYDHNDPAVCMGLTAHLHIMQQATDGSWRVAGRRQGSSHVICKTGLTLPEAVARCVISMKLGEEFEVPDELGGVMS